MKKKEQSSDDEIIISFLHSQSKEMKQVFWVGNENHSSILSVVEEFCVDIRRRYISWIDAMSHGCFNQKSAEQIYRNSDDSSFWWLTEIVEKSHYKMPITDAVKLIAVDVIVGQLTFDKVLIEGPRSRRHEAIYTLLSSRGFAVESTYYNGDSQMMTSWDMAPYFVSCCVRAGLSWCKFLLSSHTFRKNSDEAENYTADLVFVSFFFGTFHRAETYISRYWGNIFSALSRVGVKSDWLHVYVDDPNTPDLADSRRAIRQMNTESQCHEFVQDQRTPSMCMSVFLRWLSLLPKFWEFWTHALTDKCPLHVSLLCLHRREFTRALTGPSAIAALFWEQQFARLFSKKGNSKRALFYLCENQPWERAMVTAWRRHNKGKVVAVPHATVRFWDLRYFNSFDYDGLKGEAVTFVPDAWAVNGALMRSVIEEWSETTSLVDVEALRFMYLNSSQTISDVTQQCTPHIEMLVLGDYLEDVSEKLVQGVLTGVQLFGAAKVSVNIKPHPKAPIRKTDFVGYDFKVCDEELHVALQSCDVAICSHITSASVDAYATGVPVIIYNDSGSLDLSPVRGLAGVETVVNPGQLASLLRELQSDNAQMTGKGASDIMHLDDELNRWSALLADQL